MPEIVYEIPQVQLAIYFMLAAVAAMFFGILVVKPVLRLLFGTGPEFNQNLSFGSAGFNLFYGLLLGLLTVSAYQNNTRVQMAIEAEASAIAVLYNDMDSYSDPTRSSMKAMLRDYVLYTVYRDWPAHREGQFLDGGQNRASAMSQTLYGYRPTEGGETVMHAAVIRRLGEFNDARQERLNGVTTAIPNVLWYAVLMGAGVSVLLVVLLRMRPHQQFLIGTISSVFLGVILFVIVTLDQPLRGESGLEPTPFQLLWDRQMRWDEGLPSLTAADTGDKQDG
ncbi:bestrophin-like domain [Tropicimonas aquimaris]|uniref:DUF4239 domain-containing protein n=1 Tax=Tropicimonas aquimaris TaxID=914152 RepID=A0ABW3INY2_9RHOB